MLDYFTSRAVNFIDDERGQLQEPTLNEYHIERLQAEHARDILSWQYPPPYDFYNPPSQSESYIREFLNPVLQFHAVLDAEDRLVGFCSFGIDGQVPGGNYNSPALDIGLGMKPSFTDQGRGDAFFRAILDYARNQFDADRVRLTVATFNERALRLYRKFGFVVQSRFTDRRNHVDYIVLVVDIAHDIHARYQISHT